MKSRSYLILWLLMSAVAFIIYWPSVQSGFVSDDWHWLSLAADSHSLIPSFFRNYEGTVGGGSYNPIVSLFFNLTYRLFGLHSVVWHSISILIHALTATLVAFVFYHLQKICLYQSWISKFTVGSVGFLYLLWPTLTEAISWVASIPHVLGALFYTASIALYLQFRIRKHAYWLVLSILTSLLAYFSKEVTMSLPLILIILEWQIQKKDGKVTVHTIIQRILPFIIGLILFLLLRYMVTGVFFGNYVVDTLQFKWFLWWHTFLTFVVEFMTLGLARIWWMTVYWKYWVVLSLAMLTFIILIARRIYKYKLQEFSYTALLFFISLLPYIPLGFNRMSSEGERYTYVPAIFFVMIVGFMISRHVAKKGMRVACILLIVFSGFLSHSKANHWFIAGTIVNEIIDQFPAITTGYAADATHLVLALPDTISGAHVFRNNLHEALKLKYPTAMYTTMQLPIYFQMNKHNYRSQVVSWIVDERGYKAESLAGDYIVTGIATDATEFLDYELWNYDYDRYSSDTIRLLLHDAFKKDLAQKNASIIIWHKGQLMDITEGVIGN